MLSAIVNAFVSTVAVLSLMALHAGLQMLQSNMVEVSCRATWNTFNMALVSRGINPQYVRSELSTIWSVETPPATTACKPQEGKSILNIISDQGHEDRCAGFGISINLEKYLPFKPHTSELNPPSIRLSGEIHENWFPLTNLMIPALENPSGAFYRYTTDGSEPNEYSSIWNNPSIKIEDMPSEIAFKAYHADCIYVPSQTIKAAYTLPVPKVVVSREYGGNSLEVTHAEISQGHNRFVVNLENHAPLYRIEYGFGDAPVWREYTQPFHVPLDHWTGPTMTIHYRITSKIAALPQVITATFTISVKKIRLPNPTLTPGAHEALSNDDWVSAINNGAHGTLQMQSGYSAWQDTSTIQVKYAK